MCFDFVRWVFSSLCFYCFTKRKMLLSISFEKTTTTTTTTNRRGSFSTVRLVKHKETGVEFAAKIIKKDDGYANCQKRPLAQQNAPAYVARKQSCRNWERKRNDWHWNRSVATCQGGLLFFFLRALRFATKHETQTYCILEIILSWKLFFYFFLKL